MPKYYAITRRNGRWEYLCAGPDPAELYREAMDLIDADDLASEETLPSLSPATEQRLNNLRVVPEEMARQMYNVAFPRMHQS